MVLKPQGTNFFKLVNSIFIVCFLFIAQLNFGQGLGNSPYSSIGLGELTDKAFTENNGMAGVGVASSIGLYINNLNPSLLTRNKYTVFSMGMNGQSKYLKSKGLSQNNISGNFQFLNLSFPVNKKWTTGLTVSPYSTTDFESVKLNNVLQGDTTKYSLQFLAKGGITKIAINNAFEISKEISIGIEGQILFGNITRDNYSQLQQDGASSVRLLETQTYRGVAYRLGANWRHPISKTRFFNVGIVAEPSKKINGESLRTNTLLAITGVPIGNPDTLANSTLNTKISLPSDFRLGISYEKYLKFNWFADVAMLNRSQYKGFDGSNLGLKNSLLIGTGIEYYPNFESTKFLKRAVYRAGINLGTSSYSHIVTGKQLNELSVGLGWGLPLRNSSFLNLSYQYFKRGSTKNGGLADTNHKISIGFSFNDLWFIKQKID